MYCCVRHTVQLLRALRFTSDVQAADAPAQVHGGREQVTPRARLPISDDKQGGKDPKRNWSEMTGDDGKLPRVPPGTKHSAHYCPLVEDMD